MKGRPQQGGHHAALSRQSLPCQGKRRAVVRRGADERKPQRGVDRIIKGNQLGGDQSLIVVEGQVAISGVAPPTLPGQARIQPAGIRGLRPQNRAVGVQGRPATPSCSST